MSDVWAARDEQPMRPNVHPLGDMLCHSHPLEYYNLPSHPGLIGRRVLLYFEHLRFQMLYRHMATNYSEFKNIFSLEIGILNFHILGEM